MTKPELANIIKILGIDLNEVEININLGDLFFDTIEWVPDEDRILLHYFEGDYDYEFDYDEFDEELQIEIYKMVSSTLLN